MVVSIHECGEGAEEKMMEKLKKIRCVRWRTGSVAKITFENRGRLKQSIFKYKYQV